MSGPDITTCCSACGAHYTKAHAHGCAVMAQRIKLIAEQRERKTAEEAARGTLIHLGDEGTYVVDGDGPDPSVVSYNEGGYNSTSVPLSAILGWVREHRPDLLK